MNDRDAVQLADHVLVSETPAVRQFVRAVGRSESGYSTGWGTALVDQDGAPVGNPHNWGSVTTSHPPGFRHADKDRAGKPITALFKIYPTDAAGLADMAREVLKHPGVREAIEAGDGAEAVRAMGRGGYFVAPPDAYIALMARNFTAMLGATGETQLLRFAPGSSAPAAGESWLPLAMLLALGGYVLYSSSSKKDQANVRREKQRA
jgi:hypothetical protein